VDFDPNNPPKGLFIYRSQVPFDHLDMQGILHHSRHLLHVEGASHAFFEHVMNSVGFDPARFPDQNSVVRKLNIDYLHPLSGMRIILVTMRVTQLRSCAMTTAFELRNEDGKTVFSRGLREVCRVKAHELKPTMWSEEYRQNFAPWVLKTAQ